MRLLTVAAACLALLVLWPAALRAAQPEQIDLWSVPGAAVAVDASGTATLDDALASRLHFVPTPSFVFPGTASSLRPLTLWFRIPPVARFEASTGTWYLEGSRYLGYATLYVQPRDTPSYVAQTFGLRVPFAERSVRRALPTVAFKTPLAPGAPLYLRARADLEWLPLSFVNEPALVAEDTLALREQRLVFLMTGTFATLAICNILVFLTIREPAYLAYSLCMLTLAVLGPMQSNALAWQIFWPHQSIADAWVRYPALFLEGWLSLLFAYLFLRPASYAPRLAKAAIAVLAISPIVDVVAVYGFPSVAIGSLGIQVGDVQAAIGVVSFFTICLLSIAGIRAGVRGAWGLAIGFGVAFVTFTLLVVTSWYFNDVARTYGYFLQLGGRVFEGFVLFYVLADRIHWELLARLAAAKEADVQRGRAQTDGLTGLANRRALDERLALEAERSNRSNAPLGVLMIDVDHFKRFNDRYGHQAGDDCLRAVASAIARALKRPSDFAGRYGGEEFAVFLPATDAFGAVRIGETICEEVRRLRIPHEGSSYGFVSVSIGAASATARDGAPSDAIAAADAALYRAKESGRNRVAAAPEPREASDLISSS